MDYIKPTTEEFADIMDSFWQMMRECEDKAIDENDPVLKRWVEGYYRQWNLITGRSQAPSWVKE